MMYLDHMSIRLCRVRVRIEATDPTGETQISFAHAVAYLCWRKF